MHVEEGDFKILSPPTPTHFLKHIVSKAIEHFQTTARIKIGEQDQEMCVPKLASLCLTGSTPSATVVKDLQGMC